MLSGEHVKVTEAVRENASVLQLHGGSPIGNSRVKLTNVEDCVKRGLVVEGENPLHRAAEQLMMDQVTILHTIGGDDTNTQAAKIAEYLEGHNYPVTVVGMPKTIDNDVVPIKQCVSRRPWTLRRPHAIDETRLHQARPWVVSFFILSRSDRVGAVVAAMASRRWRRAPRRRCGPVARERSSARRDAVDAAARESTRLASAVSRHWCLTQAWR